MSYITAIAISEYDNKFNQVNVEQFHESQSMNLATNVSLVESQPIYYRSNDFNWTAIDDPSEMNYCQLRKCCPRCHNCSFGFCCFLLIIVLHLVLSLSVPIFVFFIVFYILNDNALRRSQKLKITDTHVDFEYNNCCYFKVKSLISLDDIWLIRNSVQYYVDDHENIVHLYSKDKCVSILGLNSSSNTPQRIIDAIIQKRPRKTQTKPYVIPNITSTLKWRGTVSLIPEDACIRLHDHSFEVTFIDSLRLFPEDQCIRQHGHSFEVAFIDSLGSVDMTFESGPSILRIFPPIDHYRSGSNHYPTPMTLYFENDDKDKLCSTFKKAVEDSRDSFK